VETRVAVSPAPTPDGEGTRVAPRADAALTFHTEVSRAVAAAVTALFVLFVYGVPLAQAVLERVKGDDSPLPALFKRAPTKENLRQFEKDVESSSYAKDYFQPRIQLLLTRFGRVGNKLAVIGREHGWLFYTPGLTYLAGPSFLDREVIRVREKEALDAGEVVHADPRPAIFSFHEMLAARGIKLILFPMPDKTMLQPMELHGRESGDRPARVAQNPGLSALVADVRAHGVEVFDPTPSELSTGTKPYFLAQDTHYTPEWMEAVARDLAATVRSSVALAPVAQAPSLHAVATSVERVGDLVDMLKLPDDQTWFPPQKVTLHQVQNEQGEPWESDDASDVLLLGDSFTNVFTMDGMGWGESAGLAPQLSLALHHGVDVIAQNDSGAYATRQALARALDGDPERLKGKRVVIWEFASRELAVGDWRPIDWAAAAHGGH
jgi:alginate O-acetyltransferase complex protein AlgJ